MSDHDELRRAAEDIELGYPQHDMRMRVPVATILAVFDERDALAARVATLETAAREVLAWEPEPGDAEWLDLTTLDRWGKDIAALRGALGDDDDG